ncbi:diacylglycerol/polyprenol kinase family protein [Geitlerinema sp. PCC 9228]|uniref:diacylglycerol/polyprenol kinase family protein n=1 Tax=Geitlerinema sp. PCC 9228 TaxID=111611 RepID=UPI000AE73271|nr:diacylglycerol/polyprenol kinase family protein [Geitlerinema sp. PCC 9228]
MQKEELGILRILEGTPGFGIQITAVGLWLALVFAAAAIAKQIASNPELVRKVVHIGTGNVILLAWWLQVPAELGIAAAIAASIVTLLSYWFPILPAIDSVGRKSLGTFFYAVSIGILVAAFWHLEQPQYAAIGILTMAWGDGLAALVGQNFGRHKYKILGNKKSWEGTTTMVAVSFVVCSSLLLATQGNCWQTWVSATLVAIAAASLETISQLGIDNLTVPLASASLAFWFGLLSL